MKITVSSDSTCDLSKELIDRFNITVIPMSVLKGGEVYKDGVALPFDEDEALELLKKDEIYVSITLHEGDAYDRMFTCDFSYDYVKINGSYRT